MGFKTNSILFGLTFKTDLMKTNQKLSWQEALHSTSDYYDGPLNYLLDIKGKKDPWMANWDGEENWLECLLKHTDPKDTCELLLFLEIYPQRTFWVDGIKKQYYCSYIDYVFEDFESVLLNKPSSQPITSQDWLRLVKAKSEASVLWN